MLEVSSKHKCFFNEIFLVNGLSLSCIDRLSETVVYLNIGLILTQSICIRNISLGSTET